MRGYSTATGKSLVALVREDSNQQPIEFPNSYFIIRRCSKGHANLHIYFNDIRVRSFILTGAPTLYIHLSRASHPHLLFLPERPLTP